MPARALIIAIEDYPASTTLVKQLPGTNASAEKFRDWLIGKKGLDAQSILACAAPACAWRTTGTTHDEIVAELSKLATNWQHENNEELYFFYSGHGFSHETAKERIEIDVFVAADFVDPDNSGDACLQFQEIQKKLLTAMGPGNHYYFIDACRNEMTREQIEVPIMGKRFPVAARGRSKYYALYSTALHQVARVQSGFADLLLQGLHGAGTAKRWEKGDLFVTFVDLRKYVRDKLQNQEIDARIGADEDGFILQIDPIPDYVCDVTVVNAAPNDSFTLKVSHTLIPARKHQFTGGNIKIKLKPFDYFLQVTHPSAEVVQIAPPSGPVSLYDTAVAQFKKLPAAPQAAQPPAAAQPTGMINVKLRGGPTTDIQLTNDESGDSIDKKGGDMDANVMPGRYTAHIAERGVEIERRELMIEPNKPLNIDLLDQQPQSPTRERILYAFTHSKTSRYADFSESLGPTVNPDLSLWLSIFGASHIVQDPRGFELLQHLQLDRFDDLQIGDSPVYVLFGSDRPGRSLRIGLSDYADVQWQSLQAVKTLVNVYERRLPATEGLHLLSLQVADESPVSLAVYCLPNRVTFVAVAEDAAGRLRIHQYLLPVHTLSQYLDPRVREYIDMRPLAVVRTIALAQTRFARNQKLQPESTTTEEEQDWYALLSGKWLDPIMSLIACYEILRNGKVDESRYFLGTVINNLRTYFPGLPDTEIIAYRAGIPPNPIDNAPLLTDGLLLLEGSEDLLRLPASRIDYSSPWTLWRGAVRTRADTRSGGSRRTRAGSAGAA